MLKENLLKEKVKRPKNFPFYKKDLISPLNNELLSKIMYSTNFENSRNRKFTSSIESYFGSQSFFPDLFPRLNLIVQPYYKQGLRYSYVLIKKSVSNAKNLEAHTLEKNALLALH